VLLGAVPRLRDLGIRPFLIADSLIGVVSQRLVRKICNHCKVAYRPSKGELRYLKNDSIEKLYRGKGCEVCNQTGYFGRTLVYELLTVDRELALMIEQEVDVHQLAAKSKEGGYVDIFDITTKKVIAGITTTEEALRTLGNIRQA
jgi:type II secretory ATPase GspE/PulE/Tfp pilus assembly ATPase PilB-like protein